MHVAAKLFALCSLFSVGALAAPSNAADVLETRAISNPRRCGNTQDLDMEAEKVV